jgi:uncharacterized repeat protein (TIGR03806 family)
VDAKKPASGLIPFDVASPLWSDGAAKKRWMALPEGKKIKIQDTGDFDFPNGTVLLKSFEVQGQLAETRFMVRHDDGAWTGYTYAWDADLKDATLLGPDGDSRFIKDQDWVFPSRQNCLDCHTMGAGRALGPELGQLNSEFIYPGNKRANQLKTLTHIGVFETAPDLATAPSYPSPTGQAGTVESRARSYLHANCSHCHQPGEAKEVALDLRWTTPFKTTNTCNSEPNKGNYGFEGAKIFKPAEPDLSLLMVRMGSTVPNVRMPQIGTAIVDTEGVAAIRAWIMSTTACPP